MHALADPSKMRNPMKESDSLHALNATVWPHQVSKQVGACFDEAGPWRFQEVREPRMRDGVYERNLLASKDLHGKPLREEVKLKDRMAMPQGMVRAQSAGYLRRTASSASLTSTMDTVPKTPPTKATRRPSSASPLNPTPLAYPNGPMSPLALLANGLRPYHTTAYA